MVNVASVVACIRMERESARDSRGVHVVAMIPASSFPRVDPPLFLHPGCLSRPFTDQHHWPPPHETNEQTGNVQLSITNIHVRYEDDVTDPGHPFACGVTLEQLSASTVDENGEEAFVTTSPLSILRKARASL